MENFDEQLIIQFLQNELSEQKEKELQAWRNSKPSNEKHFQEVKFIWEKSKLTKPYQPEVSVDLEKALSKVNDKLPSAPSSKIINFRRQFIQVSAVAAVILLAGLFWMLQLESIEMIKVETLANEKKKVILPDESVVWLNENSQLSYPKTFEGNLRELEMKGNLVFEVTPNPKKPFMVKSSDLAVQVLGTKFNVVSSDSKNKNSFVHVLHGKVKVQRDDFSGNQIILEKGMSAKLDGNDALALTDDFSPNRLFWLNKTLEFNEEKLQNVFADLEDIFKVKLEIEQSEILKCEFSGKFDETINLEKLLEMMTIIFSVEIEKINSNHFKIKKGTC